MDIALLIDTLDKSQQPSYRLKQILKNYYSGRFSSFDQMSDLPKDLRAHLAETLSYTSFNQSKIFETGGTKKALLTLHDHKAIETVLMDYDNWMTACVSTQVGCPMGCTFCATGKMGFVRNLSADEIVDQIVFWNQQLFPSYIGRIVFMGMGEPFANWDNTIAAIDMINSKDKLNIGSRKISISTSGIIPKIKEFADRDTEINLAVSLHSAVQSTRASIMPVAKSYPINDLIDVCQYYVRSTKRQLFFEYALIKDVNDTDTEIRALIKLIKSHHLFFLNLIPLNPVPGGLIPTTLDRITQITHLMDREYVPYSLRRSFGSTINAACGQLATTQA